MSLPSLLLTLAIILSGECGPLGSRCELAVARTIVARVESSAFPDDLSAILRSYYGRGEPTPTSLALARLIINGELEAGRYLYAYSEQDRRRMGWRPGDATISGYGLTLHLSERWPGR